MKTVYVYVRKPSRIMREVLSMEAPNGDKLMDENEYPRILRVKETKVPGAPRAIICMLIPEANDNQVICFGISKCNLNEDTFSKPFGRQESLKRAKTIQTILEKNPVKKRDSFWFNLKHEFGHIPMFGIESEKESEQILKEIRYQCPGCI